MRFLGLDELQDLPLAGDYLTALVGWEATAGTPCARIGRFDGGAVTAAGYSYTALAAIATRALEELSPTGKGTGRNQPGGAYDDLMHLLRIISPTGGRGWPNVRRTSSPILSGCTGRSICKAKSCMGSGGLGHVLQSPLEGAGPRSLPRLVRQSSLPVHNKVVSLLCRVFGVPDADDIGLSAGALADGGPAL